MKVGWNGHIIDEREAVISVFDHGFLYGMGCFETLRTYGGKPFLLDEHMDRLEQSCHQIGIRLNTDRAKVRAHIQQLLVANRLEDAYIRYSVSAGSGEIGLPADDYEAPNTVVYMKPLPARQAVSERKGRALQVLRLPRNTPEGDLRIKSFHYMNNILAKRELSTYSWAQGAEGLFLTAEGMVAEGIVSNIFAVRHGEVFTPALSTGILPGITRGFIIRLLQQYGFAVAEARFPLEELLAADEVFLTNSIQEIVPVHRIFDGQGRIIWRQRYSDSSIGPLSEKLLRAYLSSTEGGLNN